MVSRLAASLEDVPCPGCQGDCSVLLAEESGLGVRRCSDCAMVYVSPRLVGHQSHYHGDPEQILAKYGPVLRGERGHNRDPNYREELAVLRRFRPSGRLLDVGTHCGFFLRLARGMGWELVGVEPSPSADLARRYFGLDVRRGHLEEIYFPAESFDLVTLIDVVEHLDDPGRLLAEVRRILKPDGLVFIKTPNARYSLFKHALIRQALRLEDVEIFDAKEHLVHYTRETLGRTLARAGLEVVHAFVPRPIQDGAAWKCALRSAGHGLARVQHALGGGSFGPLAADLAVLVRKHPMGAPAVVRPRHGPGSTTGRRAHPRRTRGDARAASWRFRGVPEQEGCLG